MVIYLIIYQIILDQLIVLLQNCVNVYNTILEEYFGICEEVAQQYRKNCHQLFNLATIFTGDDVAKVNGLDKQTNDDPTCDGLE